MNDEGVSSQNPSASQNQSTSNSSPSIEELKQQRASSRGSITRIKNFIDANPNLSITELECRLGIVESYYKQAIYYQTQIERLQPQDNARGDLDELFITVKTKILSLTGEGRRHSFQEQTFSFPHVSSNRLPNLRLPKFDGKYIEYKNFINTFNNLVNNDTNIPKIEKFNHLLSCLSGEALSTIKAFQITEENYSKALDRLKERYDNDTLIFLENITAMFEVSKASKPMPKQLRQIVDTISALYSSLKSLGSFEQICDAIVIHLAMNKVDSETKQKWDEHIDFTHLPSWVECCAMLDRRCQQLDAQCKRTSRAQPLQPQQNYSQNNTNSSQKRSSNYSHNNSFFNQHSLLTKQNSTANLVCNHCSKSGHQISTCQQFIVLPVDQRWTQVNQSQLCQNCLARGHALSNCSSKYSCRFCKQRHHSLLHKSEEEQTVLPSSAAVHTTTDTNFIRRSSNVILATALILVKDAHGDYKFGRALLDSCSQVNFISDSLCHSLDLKKSKNPTDILGIGSSSMRIPYQTQTTIRSRLNNFEMSLEFLVSPKITGYHPDENILVESLNLPHNIELADPEFHISRGIDMLLGADAFFSLLAVGQIRLGDSLPMLQKTLFGWIVSGKCSSTTLIPSTGQSFCTSFTLESLNKNVEKFWKLEDVESERQTFTEEQQRCEQHFADTTSLRNDGRIMVKLPFKGDPATLGNSKDIAFRRFLSIERKLNKNPELKAQYSNFMSEYESLGHMSLFEKPDLNSSHYYIPHHCVLKPDSETTKLRVVFDASCRTASQISLNEILMVGPTLQPELLTTLLRFRCHRYGLTADITKMYRQVLMHPDDRKFQLILWRDDPSKPISTFQLNTVTYGTASAPYLAIRSLKYAADNFQLSHKVGKSVLTNDFYVDDMLTGADDLHSLQIIKNETSEILQHFKFSLSKWHSSHPMLRSASTDSVEIQLDDEITSTLGITWHPTQDIFCFAFRPTKTFSKTTKRSILSLTSSLFDPMGLISPLIIKSKILLQQLWILKLDWDESVPQDIETSWNEILQNFHQLPLVRIPRYVLMMDAVELEVHGFADASMKAYGCCLYFRCKDSKGNVAVNLLASKSRVAPLKTRTLPRLELCASHLLAKFWNKIKNNFNYPISRIYFWSDSQITLHWIHSHSSTLSTFVGNRVAEIQENSTNVIWRHVVSENNPADLISRGCTVDALITSSWMNGPQFLMTDPSQWPPDFDGYISEEKRNLERRKVTHLVKKFDSSQIPYLLQQIHKFSDYKKCLRIFAYILRINKPQDCRNHIVTPSEMQQALHHIVFIIQQHYFADEIAQLQKQNFLKGPLASLSPFLENFNNIQLLHVGGRLANAEVPTSVKFPLLLPKSDAFVKHMVISFHRSNFHAGPRALVALIQQQFWIINCRSLARQVVNECIHCTRYKPKLLTQVMGQLPKDRVTATRPFEVAGVDFAGPIPTYLKIRGKTPYKSYIAVFVCFATKAVHLEAVTDLSSDAFIAALKRFVGRRGLPSKIYCDNATNFVGADAKLKEYKSHFMDPKNITTLSSHCSSNFINFSFIPPRAPHFGGLWEAAVKSAKSHLFRTLSNAHLTFEELTTALVEIEAVMNSRPISSLSSNPNDLEALTPGHFLIGCSLKCIPEKTITQNDISNLQRWQKISAAKFHFWQRWRTEYLADLQHRYRWQRPQINLQVNDLVVVQDENLPPMKWLIGRVINVIAGKDGHARVADIQTCSSTLRRPIAKLAVLPLN